MLFSKVQSAKSYPQNSAHDYRAFYIGSTIGGSLQPFGRLGFERVSATVYARKALPFMRAVCVGLPFFALPFMRG